MRLAHKLVLYVLLIIFYPNKSSDQLQAYSMLNKHVKNIDYDKFKFTTKN